MFEKSLGGTELMYNELMKRIPENLLTNVFIVTYPSQIDFSKKLIYWIHLSYDQDAVQFLKKKQNVDKISHFVFVSNWQADHFRKIFNIPGEKIQVIKNACIGVKQKLEINTNKKIKICYTSTPWRGLDILLKSWELLNPENCELHVFSSCKIYGKDFAKKDTKYEFLYDWCKRLTNVVYRGSIPNEELRKELSDFDILAYPNTFEETSCIAVIEAISAGLRVITPTLGALPETTEGWARTYSYVDDKEKHAQIFSKILLEEINKFKNGELTEHLIRQSEIYSKRWHWDERIKDWIYFLNKIQNPKLIIEINSINKYFTPESILDISVTKSHFCNILQFYPKASYLLIGNKYDQDFKKLEIDSITNKNWDLIKIDAQYSDIDIINSGLNTIKKSKGIIIEVSLIKYNLQNDIVQLMKSLGFEPVEILDRIYHIETDEYIQNNLLFINNNLIIS